MKRTQTLNVPTDKGLDTIKIELRRRSSAGNFIGWRCLVNGKMFINCLYRLTPEEAFEYTFVKFIKEHR